MQLWNNTVARRLSALVLHLSAKNPTFERKKIHDWAHFTLAIYLRKKIKIIKLLRNYYKNDL